jgi:phosphatidylcholine synthase
MNAIGNPPVRPGLPRIVLAWGVHLYTALGLVCAAGMAVLIVNGDRAGFRDVFWLMFLATFIDATDGTLARLVRIKVVLPGFDGRKLDELVDYLTFVALPLLLIWRAHLLPAGTELFLLLPLLAGAYGFCQAEAKTADGHFLGFPSYWNLVAFYLYVLQPLPGWLSLGLVIVPAVFTFVPSVYLYPSQKGLLNRLSCVLGVPWAVLLAVVLWRMPDDPGTQDGPTRELALWSLTYPIFYLGVSWVVTLLRWRRKLARARARGREAEEQSADGTATLPAAPSL